MTFRKLDLFPSSGGAVIFGDTVATDHDWHAFQEEFLTFL
jgi:hypothetical protein